MLLDLLTYALRPRFTLYHLIKELCLCACFFVSFDFFHLYKHSFPTVVTKHLLLIVYAIYFESLLMTDFVLLHRHQLLFSLGLRKSLMQTQNLKSIY